VDPFRQAVEKTKALAKQYGKSEEWEEQTKPTIEVLFMADQKDKVYERQWDGIKIYSNLYTTDNYTRADIKVNSNESKTKLTLFLCLCRTTW
jgi:hypothetical protein